jgi:plastocyanin
MTARHVVIFGAAAIVVILVVTGIYYFVLRPGGSTTVTIVATGGQGKNYTFTPANFTVKEGQQVTLVFVSRDSAPHELVIPLLGVTTQIVDAGATKTVSFTPEKVGTFIVMQPCGAGPHQDVLPCNIQGYATVLSP